MEYIDSIEKMRTRAGSPNGKSLVSQMKETVTEWMGRFSDDPAIESGWGHVYFCSQCGTFLTFDLKSPHAHVCGCCGKTMTGPEYDASWVYLYRYDALMSAVQSAALYRLEGKKEYLDYFQKVVGFYAENWYRFCEHGRNTWPSGNGKITPQALNEAIFLVRIAGGLELLKGDLEAGFFENVCNWMLIPCAYFLDAQKRWIHNIPCWLNASVGAVGLLTGNADLIDRAFDRKYGFADQVRGGGVTESFFWYEGSIHYNFFTLEAFMNTLLFAHVYGKEVPQDVEETVFQMLLAPCKYAFSNGQLPNPNDGWPNLGLKTYSFVYEMGAKIFAGREDGWKIAAAAKEIREAPYHRVPVPLSYPVYAGDVSLEWLLFAQEAVQRGGNIEKLPYFKRSYLFEASNFATLKGSNIEIFHKFGHCTKSHAHPDKMSIEVRAFGERISHDLSNCGYAAKLCPEFHRTSVSHNTVVMDGLNHPTTNPGKVLSYQDNAIRTLAPSAYDEVDFSRSIQLRDNGFRDSFEVIASGSQPHTYDWLFHVDGCIVSKPDTVSAELGFHDNGYQYLNQIEKVCQNGTITLEWEFSGGIKGIQKLEIDGMELFICQSPDNPPSQDGKGRTTLLLRSRAENPIFVQNWDFSK